MRDIERKKIKFYCFLIIIASFIEGSTLEQIQIHIVAKQIAVKEIDYNGFREMKLPKSWKTIDRLTLSMMINDYDLTNKRQISRQSSKKLLTYLTSNHSFIELSEHYKSILSDIQCFPLKEVNSKNIRFSFDDSWNSERSYGGNRKHEGTDIMPEKNLPGFYPVISMTDGIVDQLGWLELGGYRIGIRGTAGAYFYYAHLDSYAPDINVGDTVKAGQFLGYMGDSGYGKEGTKGKFDVHLHIGIYILTKSGEVSVNPYWILRYLKNQ